MDGKGNSDEKILSRNQFTNPDRPVGAKRKSRFIGEPNSDLTTKITKNKIFQETEGYLRVLRALRGEKYFSIKNTKISIKGLNLNPISKSFRNFLC